MQKKSKKIELNGKFKEALELMENTDHHIFVTGKAGTGKSTLLNYFRENTQKKIVVLAPTGVAAVNIKGQTVHSFFGFKPNVTLSKVKKVSAMYGKICKKIDAIVIDEISMVRADLLDCVDKFLRINGKKKNLPFGGVQMIFIGDLYQLPPIISRDEREIFKEHYKSGYFFSSFVFENFEMDFIELEKIYRQKDEKFISTLNNIRNNSVTEKDLFEINKRLDLDFEPKEDDFYVYLTTTNDLSRKINEEHLKKVKGEEYFFKGKMKGRFEEKHFPTDLDLTLKDGAQVMLLNNDSKGRWINGSIGKVMGVGEGDNEDDVVFVELESGEVVEVGTYNWTIFKYIFNDKANALETEESGSFEQYPLKLAWSLTIHKSQGKTFDKAIIDVGRGTFAFGQMYVALSRCVSLEGLVLKKPIEKRHIFIDWKVVEFVTKYQYQISEKNMPLEEKVKMIKKTIKNKKKLKIVYLKANDERSERTIEPSYIGDMEYAGRTFLGMKAICLMRGESRVFKVDRILEMENV
ncbi:AAA family ATPase [Candidatus Parcubacteria bacterium]|nr:AAA family ATPase [Candidatus Parcubacteria bacterium]